jgi:hypothetical protein
MEDHLSVGWGDFWRQLCTAGIHIGIFQLAPGRIGNFSEIDIKSKLSVRRRNFEIPVDVGTFRAKSR